MQLGWYWLKPYRWKSMQDKFRTIYQENVWGNRNSLSGDGSDLSATEVVRWELPQLLGELEVKTFLDVPCGDFFWMKEVDLTGIEYIGGDIVPEIIAKVQTDYSRPGCTFSLLNLVTDPLPKVDLIMCRDCLFHFSFADALAAIRNIKKSGSTYLLTTTFPQREINIDILTGHWRPINLCLPPYDFPTPLRLIGENCMEFDGAYADKSLALWKVVDLPS